MKLKTNLITYMRLLCMIVLSVLSLSAIADDELTNLEKEYRFPEAAKGRVGYWSDENICGKNEPPLIDGTYHISTPEQLGYVAWEIGNMNDAQGYLHGQFVLDADLDMSAHFWERIPGWDITSCFTGSIDGQGHTISNLYCVDSNKKAREWATKDNVTTVTRWAHDADHSGSFIGCASGATFSNITFYHYYGDGGNFVGIVGQSLNSITFTNVHMIACGMSTNATANTGAYAGGFIGSVRDNNNQSKTITITNCSSDITIKDCGWRIGGFIGDIEGAASTVKITNSVSYTNGNNYFPEATGTEHHTRGGFIGAVYGKVFFYLNNVAAYTEKDEGTLMSFNRLMGSGYPMGGAFTAFIAPKDPSNGHLVSINGQNLFIDAQAAQYSNSDMWRFAMGANGDGAFSTIRPVMPSIKKDTREDALPTIVTLNEGGMCLGVEYYNGSYYARPLTDSIGKLVRYAPISGPVTVTQYTSEVFPSSASLTDDAGKVTGYLSVGKQAQYDVTVDDTHWVMADTTSTLTERTRTSATTFKAVPTAGGKLGFDVATRPEFQWISYQYNLTKQQTILRWQKNADTDLKAWKDNKAQFTIYRNGEKVDSVSFSTENDNAFTWTDKDPEIGTINQYEVRVECPSVFYTERHNPSQLTCDVDCSGMGTATSSISGKPGAIKVRVDVPNSVAYDSCHITVRKYMVGDVDRIQLNDTTATNLGEQLFRYNRESADSTLSLTFTDDAASVPCTKWVYQAQCYNFAPKSSAAGTTRWSNAVEMLPITDFAIAGITSSKGESTSKINVSWKIDKGSAQGEVRQTLLRKLYKRGESNLAAVEDSADWREIYTITSSSLDNSYTDEVLPGYVYKYMIKAYPNCDGTYAKNVYQAATTIGYAASRGTIMGRITYEGNTAVQGVDVRLTAEKGSFNQKSGLYAAYFDGTSATMPLATALGEKFWQNDWTLTFLLQPVANDDQPQRLLALPGHFNLLYQQGKLTMGSQAITLPVKGQYNSVMLRHNKKAGTITMGYATDTIVYWTSPVTDKELIAALPQGLTTYNDSLLFGGGFRGYLDEVRLWNNALTDDQITDTYNRYLSGSEEGLEAYYTFDAGVEEYAFDTSHPGGKWNNHHTSIPNVGHPAITDDCLPTEKVLTYRGATDKNGEYQISGIPFVGEGSNYQVVPYMGTHTFSPASTRRYVSQQSLNYSDVNFTDKSSFVVPVQAYYVYGSIPAEGLNVIVDGTAQTDADHNPILTDANGSATVSVPIGQHIVSLSATQHTLVNNGQPCQVDVISSKGACRITPVSQNKGLINFQKDLTAPLMFYDSTLVRIVGRVAGGSDESNKPVGFEQGLANIGSYDIALEPNGAGMLNKTSYTDLEVIPDTVKTINSQTMFRKNIATITTDSKTGEYVATLPPVKWKINSVTAHADGMADIDLTTTNRLFTINVTDEKADTLWLDTTHNAMDTTSYVTFKYNKRLDFIKYNAPTFTVLNADPDIDPADSLMLGERKFDLSYVDETSNATMSDSVFIWRTDHAHDATAASYATGYPVFISDNKYRLRFKLFETYTNHDTKQVSQVPVRDANIEVNNKLASSVAEKLDDGNFQLLDTLTNATVVTDAGVVDYVFTAGLPNTIGNYLLPLTISYNVHGSPLTHTIQGCVTGGFSTHDGNNFVTEGPNQVIGVLIDPPGSTSSSYLTSGSTMKLSLARVFGATVNVGIEKKNAYNTTIDDTEIIGTKLVKLFDVKNNTKVDHGISSTTSRTGAYGHTYSLTASDKISTGTDAYHVGANGDVYMGVSTNWVFSNSKFLEFQNVNTASSSTVTSATGHHYKLGVRTGIGQQSSLGTTFRLSQYDIIHTEIPLFRKMRAALIPESHYVDKLPKEDDKTYGSAKAFTYYALASSRDKELWEYGTDYITVKPTGSDYGILVDSVTLYNQRISQWQQVIANTEATKYKTFQNQQKKQFKFDDLTYDYGYIGNKTFDGVGTSIQNAITFSKGVTYRSNTSIVATHNYAFGTETDVTIGDNAKAKVFTFTTSEKTSASVGREYSDASDASTTIGYTLSDNNLGDRFSVDVYLDAQTQSSTSIFTTDLFVPNSYYFNLVAGQTRVPWEKPTQSLYYKVNGQSVPISGGSVSLDVPTIHFAKREISDIPSGSTVNVELTVGNASTGTADNWSFPYTINDLNKNTHGLIAKINGAKLDGYGVALQPGFSKTVTVSFTQTDPNVLDYDNLVYNLLLSESASDTISLHFRPQASPVTITSNDGYVLNGEKSTKRMLMNLSDYHPEYSQFAGIRLQYCKKEYDTWTTQSTLINDSALYASFYGTMPESWRKLSEGSDSLYLDMTDIPDGEYLVRAQTFSIIAGKEMTRESKEIAIIKDTTPLSVFGKPRPLNGIYVPGEEVSITFNKDIDASKLTADNFHATAPINDAPYNHYCGLHFDGSNPASTTSRVDLLSASSAIGLWYKPQVGKRSCLLSQDITGLQNNELPLKIWYNEDATMTLEILGQTFTSKQKAVVGGQPCTDWMYLIFRYDKDETTGATHVNLYDGYGTASVSESTFIDEDLTRTYMRTDNVDEPLYVGGSSTGDACYAEMQGLVIYDNASSLEKMYADKDSRICDNLRGIAAYWPMDEGYGTKIADKVRSRDLHIKGLYNWYVPYTNYALHLDGTSQYAILNTSQCGIDDDGDYVVEMLFRTDAEAKDRHMTLFSNGWGGEGSDEEKTYLADRLSLAVTPAGAIEFNFAGRTSVLGSGYNDNQWHHLSLNVQRDGYVTISVDTVNISSAKPIMGSALGALSNLHMTLGALRYRSATGESFQVSDFFQGDIDEVRIWDAHRAQAVVNHNILLRLAGNETGLAAYYPFERSRLISNSTVVQPTVSNCVTNTNYNAGMPQMVGFSNVDDTTALAKEATVSTGAGLKPYLVDSPVLLKYYTSQTEPNKVIIDFADNVKMSTIQGCSVNLSVADLMDQHGNYQNQPFTWNLYVDARDVKWKQSEINSTLDVGETWSEEPSIINTSTSRVNWTISNIPSWLTVSPTSGVLGPKEDLTIHVTFKETTPIGQHTASLLLSSDLGVDDKCLVNLTVTGKTPLWEDQFSDADESMTILGTLKIAGQWSTDPNSIVGAFDCDGLCHGVASPKYDQDMDKYFVNLTVHGNMPEASQKLIFKVWDSQTGLTYSHVYLSDAETSRTDSLLFVNGRIHGNFTRPCVIETSETLQQTFHLSPGWNWVSNWVTPPSHDINEVFQKGKGVVDYIKRQVPTNTFFDPSESYHLYTAEGGDFYIDGTIISPKSVSIHLPASSTDTTYSYTWIGYPEDRILTLDEAFADFQPNQDDVIKSQSGFAMYNGKRWSGSISYLEPGVGYIYARKGSEAIWQYPNVDAMSANSAALRTAPLKAAPLKAAPLATAHQRFADVYHRHSANMVTVQQLQVDGQDAPQWQIEAYVAGVCRGWALTDSTSRAYLTIAGDSDALVTYRACNTANGVVVAVRQKHPFHTNDVLGTCYSPYRVEAEMPTHYVIDDDLPYSFEDYTYVTASVIDAPGVPYAHDYELAAYYGGELRGSAVGHAGEACEMAIYGKAGETYTFKLYDKTTLEEIELVGEKEYDSVTPVQTVILHTPAYVDGIQQITVDTKDHQWYDTGGISYGHRQPQKRGVYIRDHKQVTVTEKTVQSR